MRVVLNIIWLVFGGLLLAVGYALAGIAAFRMALFCSWPFGRTLIRRDDAGVASMIGNVIWFILAGWWLALGHLVTGVLMCLTGFVIGAIFVITNGISAGSLDVGERVMWFALGSLVGVVVMVAAYARDAPPPRPSATPLWEVLMHGAQQLRRAIVDDALLRAHALRLASIVAATTLLYQALELQHGYWVPLTVLAVLQPNEHASNVRAIQRAAGTVVGTALIALITIATGSEWLIVACQGVAAFGLFALFARGYFWLVVLITPTALLSVGAVDYQGVGVAIERAGWSALGIVLGLAIAEVCWRLAPHLPRTAAA